MNRKLVNLDISMDEDTAKNMVLVRCNDLKAVEHENSEFRKEMEDMKKELKVISGRNKAMYEMLARWIDSQMAANSSAPNNPQQTPQSSSRKRRRHVRSRMMGSDVDGDPSTDSDPSYSPRSLKTGKVQPKSFPITRATTGGSRKLDYSTQIQANQRDQDSSIEQLESPPHSPIPQKQQNTSKQKFEKPPKLPMHGSASEEIEEVADSDNSSFAKRLIKEKVEDASKKSMGNTTSNSKSTAKKFGNLDDVLPTSNSKSKTQIEEIPERHTYNVKNGVVVKWKGRLIDSTNISELKHQKLTIQIASSKGYKTLKKLWGDSARPNSAYFSTFRLVVLGIISEAVANIACKGTLYVNGKYHLQDDDRTIDEYVADLPEPLRCGIEMASRIFFDENPTPTVAAAQFEVVRATVEKLMLHMPTYHNK